MDIEGGPPIEAVGEHEIDYAMAQLLSTSPRFRRWFVSRSVSDIEFDEHVGVITHASYGGEGESDIEFGFTTPDGDRHVLLIENKIDATKQPNQIERYYNRGRLRVDRGNWDSFTVSLLAPESYVSTDDVAGFDSIVHYEDVQTQLDDLSHDGAPFFRSVFEAAQTKSDTVDASETIAEIRDRVLERTDLPLVTAFTGRKRVSFRSNSVSASGSGSASAWTKTSIVPVEPSEPSRRRLV